MSDRRKLLDDYLKGTVSHRAMRVHTKVVWQWIDGKLVELPEEGEGYDYAGPVALATSGSATRRQIHYRIRTDTGTVDAAPTWAAAEDTTFWPGFDTNFRVRMSVENTGTAAGTVGNSFSYTRCGGSVVSVTTSTPFFKTADASTSTDNTATNTQRLTSGAGSYVAGRYTEDGIASISLANGSFSEFEIGCQILSADCGGGEAISVRSQGVLEAIPVDAAITTPEQTGTDFQPGNRLGGAGSSSGSASLSITTAAVAAAGKLVVVCVAKDNTSTVDGDNGEVTSITDSAGGNTWIKAKEFTNAQGSAAAGTTVSIWYSKLTNQINNGGTITANFSSIVSKTMTAQCFTVAAGKTVAVEATNSVATDATSTQPTSLDATTANIECLRICASSIEAGGTEVGLTSTLKTTTGGLWSLFRVTPFSGNVLCDCSNVGGDVLQQCIVAEATISTGTGRASRIRTGAVSRDWATAYVAFKAVTGDVTLTPGLVTDTDTFYAPTVTRGAKTLTPGLVSDGDTFYAPKIVRTVKPGLYTDTDTFYAPTVTKGVRTLSPALYTDTDTLYAPKIVRTVFPALYSDADTFYAPTVSQITTLHPGLCTDGDTFYAPTVTAGAVTLSPALFEDGGGATFDPANKGAGVTLSNGNLTATTVGGSVYRDAAFTNSRASGKYVFEITLDTITGNPGNLGIGFASSFDFTAENGGNWLGRDANSYALFGNGTFWTNNAQYSTAPPSFAQGDTVSIAIDLDDGLIWTRTNGGDWNDNPSADPATGTGGETFTVAGRPLFAGVSLWGGDSETSVVIANLSPASLPAGFSAWSEAGDTFYSPTVTQGAATLTPSLYTDADVFYAPTVTNAAFNLFPPLHSDTNTFYAPTVTPGVATLYPDLFIEDPRQFFLGVDGNPIFTGDDENVVFYGTDAFWRPTIVRTVHPALYSDADVFYAPTVTTGVATISPALYTDGDAFYAPTVTAGAVTILPGLYSDGDTFYVPKVSQSQAVAPGLYTDADAFYSPTVTTGAATISPGLYTDGDSVYAPTIIRTVHPGLYADADAFYAPTVTAGAVTLSPSLFSDGDTFYSPVISTGVGQLFANLYSDADVFYAPTVTAGAVTVSPSLYSDADSFYSPTIVRGLKPGLYTDADVFYAPKIARGLRPALYTDADAFYAPTVTSRSTLTPALYSDADAFYSPTVTTAKTLAPALYSDADTFYSPTVLRGARILTPALYSDADAFYSPTIRRTVRPALYSDADTFYSPTIQAGAATIAPALYSDADAFYGPTVSGRNTLTPGLFDDADAFYSPTVSASNTVFPGLFSDADIVYAAEVGGGDTDLQPELFSDGDVFYSPVVSPGAVTISPALFVDGDSLFDPRVTRQRLSTLTRAGAIISGMTRGAVSGQSRGQPSSNRAGTDTHARARSPNNNRARS